MRGEEGRKVHFVPVAQGPVSSLLCRNPSLQLHIAITAQYKSSDQENLLLSLANIVICLAFLWSLSSTSLSSMEEPLQSGVEGACSAVEWREGCPALPAAPCWGLSPESSIWCQRFKQQHEGCWHGREPAAKSCMSPGDAGQGLAGVSCQTWQGTGRTEAGQACPAW